MALIKNLYQFKDTVFGE